MKLAPRYCRTCGSRILLRNICHNCGTNPLEGNNYCYDCGALTPKEVMCTNCGATFKRKTSAATILIASLVIIAIAGACFFIFRNSEESQSLEHATNPVQKPEEIKEVTEIKSEIKNVPDIKINPPADSNHTDTVAKKVILKVDTTVVKVNAPLDSSLNKKLEVNIISADELSGYKIRCSYFEKKQKSNIIFFTANTAGYIKIDNKLYPLKRTKKTSDIAKYSDNTFEVIIEIDGLSGSDKEWLAAATLTIKDLLKNTTARYKVNSACIDL